MSDKNIFADRGKAFEDEHFRRQEEELVAKLRQRAEQMAERREMAAATGVEDEELLAELQAAGYNRDTVTLLHITPLVQVAWADGAVTAAEREHILEAAHARGIAEGHPAHAKLVQMLDRRPSEDEFDQALRLIRLFARAAGTAEWAAPEHLADLCRQVAEASGGFLGFGKVSDDERAILDRIASELERDHAEGARQVLERE